MCADGIFYYLWDFYIYWVTEYFFFIAANRNEKYFKYRNR